MDVFSVRPALGCSVDIGPATGPRDPHSVAVFSVRFASQHESLDVCGNEGPTRAKAHGVESREHLWNSWELSLAKP